jgi:hypothetical protein
MDENWSHLLTLLCYYGPTPLAGILAGWQATQCRSPWQAFFVALVGTVGLAVVFGVAVDFLPIWGLGWGVWHMWQLHLMASPVVAIPLGTFCAYLVQKRNQHASEPEV